MEVELLNILIFRTTNREFPFGGRVFLRSGAPVLVFPRSHDDIFNIHNGPSFLCSYTLVSLSLRCALTHNIVVEMYANIKDACTRAYVREEMYADRPPDRVVNMPERFVVVCVTTITSKPSPACQREPTIYHIYVYMVYENTHIYNTRMKYAQVRFASTRARVRFRVTRQVPSVRLGEM